MAGGVAHGNAIATQSQSQIPAGAEPPASVRSFGGGRMQKRKLGRTGESVSILGVGGFHLGGGDVDVKLAIRIVRGAIDGGITFMDNSWDYNDGKSERRMGKALRDGYREKAFLMTKVDGRSRKAATEQLDESLERLGTDCIDLVQHHEVIRFEDADRIFAEDGANPALLEAREAGKLRWIGFTGHKDPHVHLHMLEVARDHGFAFDTVQMPPSLVITGIDSEDILEQAIRIGSSFEPMTEVEISDVLARTAGPAADGAYELFKTSTNHDSTAKNVKWLGEETGWAKEAAAK
jgi:aryl-alcohol dehydrogenase-like predicted oxidoreductase